MPTKKYTTLHKELHTRNMKREMDFDRLANNPDDYQDYCPRLCYAYTQHSLVKSVTTTWQRGSTWGTRLTKIYRCERCGHVYHSHSWKKTANQMSFLDMVKADDKS